MFNDFVGQREDLGDRYTRKIMNMPQLNVYKCLPSKIFPTALVFLKSHRVNKEKIKKEVLQFFHRLTKSARGKGDKQPRQHFCNKN